MNKQTITNSLKFHSINGEKLLTFRNTQDKMAITTTTITMIGPQFGQLAFTFTFVNHLTLPHPIPSIEISYFDNFFILSFHFIYLPLCIACCVGIRYVPHIHWVCKIPHPVGYSLIHTLIFIACYARPVLTHPYYKHTHETIPFLPYHTLLAFPRWPHLPSIHTIPPNPNDLKKKQKQKQNHKPHSR